MILTHIRPTHPRDHFRLKFADGSSLTLSADSILENHLKVGFDVPPALLNKLGKLSLAQSHFNAASHFLSYRPRSTSELTLYLKKRGATPKQIEDLLKRFSRLNLLDDATFATWLLNSRLKRGRSPAHIRYELQHFGISPTIISSVFDSLDPTLTSSSLTQLILKKARSLSSLPPSQLRQKLTAYLYRKGFSGSVVATAIDHYLKKD